MHTNTNTCAHTSKRKKKYSVSAEWREKLITDWKVRRKKRATFARLGGTRL